MIGPEFASCWLKLGRAEEHFQTFKSEVIAWNNRNPYLITKKCDTEGRRHSLVVEIKSPPALDRWALIAGDCIHNIRSVLDNLVYAVAVVEAGSNPPPGAGKLQFPIAKTAEQFAKQRSRIASLSSSMQARIEGVQPYNRPRHDLPPLLSILNEFDNVNKHRLLNLVFANAAEGKLSFSSVNEPIIAPSSVVFYDGPIESGTELLHFTREPPKTDFDYKFLASMVISVAHEAGPSGRTTGELGYLLEILIAEVRSIVDSMIL